MANEECLTLDGVELHDGSPFLLMDVDLTPPEKTLQWVRSSSQDGATLVEAPFHELREIKAKVQVTPQASMNAALDAIGTLVDKLQLAERTAAGGLSRGLPMVYSPAGSTYTYTFYLKVGRVVGLPADITSGWLVKGPTLDLSLLCDPAGYGAEVTPTPSVATNLVTNPATGPTFGGWNDGTSVFIVTEGSLSGGPLPGLPHGSLVMSCSTAASADSGCHIDVGGITNGATVSVRIWVLKTGGDPVKVAIGRKTAPFTEHVIVAAHTSATLTQYTLTFTATATDTYSLYLRNTGTAATSIFFHAAFVNLGSAISYFDGRSGGARWTGVPDASTSELLVGGVASSTDPLQTFQVQSVPGDLAAEGRLIVEDLATQPRDNQEVGWDQATGPSPLILDSDFLVTSGFAGAGTTRSGSFDPGAAGNNVIRATLASTPVVVCGTGDQLHTGTFRVKARVYASADGVSIRLASRTGRDSFSRPPSYVSPPAAARWCEVDLGTITIATALQGTQTWEGRVEAYATTAGTTVDVDALWLIPASNGYGKARATAAYESATAFSARDEFDQSAGALTGKTLPAGGTWTVVGAGVDADDFQVNATNHNVTRATVSDTNIRAVYASTPNLATAGVRVDLKTDVRAASLEQGVVFRYPSGAGPVVPHAKVTESATATTVSVFQTAQIAFVVLPPRQAGTVYTLAIAVFPDGRGAVWFFPAGAAGATPVLWFQDSGFVTAGTYDDGFLGVYDYNSTATACTRTYDNFAVWVPELDHVMFSGQSTEFRAFGDACSREDSTGTYYGRPGEYNGSRFWLPAGTSRVVAKGRRLDVDTLPDENIADSTKVTVAFRPRWLVVPRQA